MRPLEGVKIVEMGIFVVIPAAARLLSDWGAEVIKVEKAEGDNSRKTNVVLRLPNKPDCCPYFAALNSGKRLISLNLKDPDGLKVLMDILGEADVFMTNFRYGGLTRLGLDYETLHKKFPRLIFCHVNGYGHKGPDKDRPGFDQTCFWARSGILNAMHDVGARARVAPSGVGDTITGNALAAGIAAALIRREKTGEGSNITSSLYANGIWCNAAHVTAGQKRPEGDPDKPYVAPHPHKERRNPFGQVYECKDGRHFFLLGGSYGKLSQTLRALGLEEYADDPRFKDHPTMQANSDILYDLMEEAFRKKTAGEWRAIMEEMGISYEILYDDYDTTKDPQAWENGFLTRMTCPNGLEYVAPNTPVEFSGVERVQTTHAGWVGSDTRAVLAEYGYTEEQIDRLLESGAVTAC